MACAPQPTFADVAIWKNTTAPSANDSQWGVPANWTDADGNALAVAPTNGTCDVRVPALSDSGETFTIRTGTLSGSDSKTYLDYPAVNPSIASFGPTGGVWTTRRWVIEHSSAASQYMQPGFKRVFTMADASGFDGYWTSAKAKAVFELAATAEATPGMSALSATYRPYVRVPSAGTAGTLQSVYTPGTVSKAGDGELKVGSTRGEETRFTIDAGTLTLEGESDAEIEALVAKAALHLDASRADTLVTYPKTTDGVEYQVVTNWYDVNGNGGAYQEASYSSTSQYFYPWSHGAFVSPVKSPTGLSLVDFGSHAQDAGAFGPSNCWLRLSQAIKNPTAVFYVVQTPGGSPGCTILGQAGDSGYAFLTERSDRNLFCSYSAGAIGRKADILVNGVHYDYPDMASLTTTTLKSLNVLSLAVEPGAIIELLGSDRHYTSRSGGSRLGEVLVFTTELTRAERVRLSQYLTRKWITGAKPVAADAVVAASGASVGVPAGRTARVGEVCAAGGALVKTGAGTLAVGAVLPKGAAIRVEGGSVAFDAPKAIADDAPASDPYVWLDATDAASLVTTTVDGDDRSFVTQWKDCRADSDVVATAVSNSLPRMPWIVSDIGNGRGAAVSLGNESQGTQSHFILPTWGADGAYGSGQTVVNDTYAGFLVFRNNRANGMRNYFGSSNMDMMRAAGVLLTTTYTADLTPGAFWSINGAAADAFASYDVLKTTDDVIVLAFRSSKPVTVNAIAKDRKGEQYASAGSITVGEFITYHRELTAEEFRKTEAYLLKKWRGESHPLAAAAVPSLEFADSADAVLESAAALDVASVSGGSGAFVKRGEGSVTVRSPLTDAAKSISVEDGSLTMAPDAMIDAPDALFHFDASREETLATYAGDDGKTYVTSWASVGSNALYACTTKAHPAARIADYKFVATNPTLASVTMPDGVVRKVVDFGNYRNTATMEAAGTNSAAFYFSQTVNGAVATQTKVREIYVVQKRSDVSPYGAHFIGNLEGYDWNVVYMRGNASLFNMKYTSPCVTNGYLALDRVVTAASATLPAGWHLISVGASGDTRVDGMMIDRNCNAGGGSIAEMIAFDHELTAAQRAELERQLMIKWGIGSETAPMRTLETLDVATGATLDVRGLTGVTVASLSGGGALKASALAVTDSLTFAYRGADDVDCLEVTGPVDLSGLQKVTVKLDLPAGERVAEGEWTLLSATGGLTGLDDLSQVELVIDGKTKRNAALRLRDGALCIRFTRRGGLVIVW